MAFVPGGAAVPVTQVELGVSCRNLKDTDALSKSDPMCVLFMKDKSGSFREIGRTEVIKDTHNPDFVTKFIVDYYFEESQKLRFFLYDVDSKSQNLADHDFLGSAECSLGEIVSCQGSQFRRVLSKGNSQKGVLSVVAEEVGSCKTVARMQWSAKNLDKKDFLGKSDPFLVFYKCNADKSFSAVFKTEVIKNTLNPTWRPFKIHGRLLCGGDESRPIKVECYDWDSDGDSHDLIGEFFTDLKALSLGPCPENVYECINPKKKANKKSYKNSGVVTLVSCSVEEEATFLDYIKGGLQLNFTVAVDFTASNGPPHDPNSLHYMDPHRPSAYTVAIQSVGEIIQDYDTDKMFPALGFGARLPPNGVVSHEFFLNGDPSNPYCAGVAGILEAYQRSVQTVQLYGPTNFAPVIYHVARFANSYQDGTHYFVLLIITDGEITDMVDTKEAIVQAASLPISIIIVGVGNADFEAMNELDGDNVRVSSGGRFAERDIVQFVAFRDFMTGRSWMEDKAALAKKVLAEVPGQVVDWMMKRGIKPKMVT